MKYTNSFEWLIIHAKGKMETSGRAWPAERRADAEEWKRIKWKFYRAKGKPTNAKNMTKQTVKCPWLGGEIKEESLNGSIHDARANPTETKWN